MKLRIVAPRSPSDQQREAEQDGEQQNLQDVALREGANHAVRDDMQDEIDRLLFARLLSVGRDGGGIGCSTGEARAGPHDVADDQADDEREGRDDLEVDERLEADPAHLLGVLDMGDARDDGAEDDRRDDHLDELDEAVAHRLDPVALRVLGREPPEEHAENDGDQHLDVEQFVPRLFGSGQPDAGSRCYARHGFLLRRVLDPVTPLRRRR